MAQLTFAQARAIGQSGGSLLNETLRERVISLLAVLASGQNPDATPFQLPVNFGSTGQQNTPATPLTGGQNQAAAANAAAVATLTAAAATTTYLTSFTVSAGSAAAAAADTVVIGGVTGGPYTLPVSLPTTGLAPTTVTFPTPLAASAINTAITVTLGASGAAGPAIGVIAQGFRQ